MSICVGRDTRLSVLIGVRNFEHCDGIFTITAGSFIGRPPGAFVSFIAKSPGANPKVRFTSGTALKPDGLEGRVELSHKAVVDSFRLLIPLRPEAGC
ncbi:MAG: hypothetical protein IPO65_20935 [Saprospiraceae bacterium]|nr:hypothetical protein [Saprospiraceae bacterium]